MNLKNLNLSFTGNLISRVGIYEGAEFLHMVYPEKESRGSSLDIDTLVFDCLHFSHAYLNLTFEAHEIRGRDVQFFRELPSMELYALQLQITYSDEYGEVAEERFERVTFVVDHDGGCVFRIGPLQKAEGIDSISLHQSFLLSDRLIKR